MFSSVPFFCLRIGGNFITVFPTVSVVVFKMVLIENLSIDTCTMSVNLKLNDLPIWSVTTNSQILKVVFCYINIKGF